MQEMSCISDFTVYILVDISNITYRIHSNTARGFYFSIRFLRLRVLLEKRVPLEMIRYFIIIIKLSFDHWKNYAATDALP